MATEYQRGRLPANNSRTDTVLLYLSKSNRHRIQTPLAPLHPRQMGLTLQCSFTIDLSQHQPIQLPCQDGWQVMRRNSRVWIAKETKNIVMLDAAQYRMIVDVNMQEAPCSPTVQLLETIRRSSLVQCYLDLEHYIHWSLHLRILAM